MGYTLAVILLAGIGAGILYAARRITTRDVLDFIGDLFALGGAVWAAGMILEALTQDDEQAG